MKVIVAGGQVRVRKNAVFAALSAIAEHDKWNWNPEKFLLIEGDQFGTDKYAGLWAKANGFPYDPTPIVNELDGDTDQAPKYRNYRMLHKQPDLVIVFPGGPGTRHMMEIALEYAIPVYDVELDNGTFKVWALPSEEDRRSKKQKAVLVTQGTYVQSQR